MVSDVSHDNEGDDDEKDEESEGTATVGENN